ncbi:hypothetical protein OpiT1DRAFT_00875 [Opitutaceae bacterium TAV1]|nr:hypothetical protein OpiT1DRAFT_00875 [Opitutaceae bacterium TAV1]
MKHLTLLLALSVMPPAVAASANSRSATSTDATQISLHATIPGDAAKAPAIVSIRVEQKAEIEPSRLSSYASIKATVLSGEADTLSLRISQKLADTFEHVRVEGGNVRDWALRQANKGAVTFLDVRLNTPLKKGEKTEMGIFFSRWMRTPQNSGIWGTSVPVLSSSDESGAFEGTLRISWDGLLSVKPSSVHGLARVDTKNVAGGAAPENEMRFLIGRNASCLLSITRSGDTAIWEKLSVTGDFTEKERRFGFVLEGEVHARFDGATLPLLGGGAALRTAVESANFFVRIHGNTRTGKNVGYELVFPKAGTFPVRLEFDARVDDSGDWRSVRFALPAARIAGLSIGGFPGGTKFATGEMPPFEPEAGGRFTGRLAADGGVAFSWLTTREEADGRLFYSTSEVSEIVVGPGLLRQSGVYTWKVLQGKLDTLRLALAGEGEILRVTGSNVLSWEVTDAEMAADLQRPGPEAPATPRMLVVRLAQAQGGGDYTVTIDSQTPLGDFPANVSPLALAPLGGVRHSGYVRVTNAGAVRLETSPRAGLTQVAPAVFPKKTTGDDTGAQQFVYRISDAGTSMDIRADNILPETGVSAVVIYDVGDSDLTIGADIELDVREAPLREFLIGIPAGYTVSSLRCDGGEGAGGSGIEWSVGEPHDGRRGLKVVFARPVSGRSLLRCRLERDRAADFSAWSLEPLTFPDAKSVRGFVGVTAAAGLRVTPSGETTGIVEIATAFFPKKTAGLQQAFRLREAAWSASMTIERLDMAVNCEALHLFAVREGMVSASTMINYAIVGAPLGAFRFEVPAEWRNLEFSGRDIRSWKREGDIVEVSLHKPVSGAFTLLGTGDFLYDPRGGVLGFAGLHPPGVQSEQGYVLVTSDLPFSVTRETVPAGLVAVEPREIPAEYRMMYDASLLAAFQYAERPRELRLGLTPRPRGATVSQVVDFASLDTRVARDGQLVTEARYVVKSHGHPHLRVSVPEGLRLWTARVDDAEVLPVVDGAATLVPLPSRPDANAIVTVDLRFAGSAEDAVRVRLDAPRIGAPVIRTRWRVTPDDGRRLVFAGGNLAPETVAAPASRPTGLRTILRGALTGSTVIAALGGALGLAAAGACVFALSLRIRAGGRRLAARIGGGLALLVSAAALAGLAAVFLKALGMGVRGGSHEGSRVLEFTAPIHAGGGAGFFLELRNLAAPAGGAAASAGGPGWAVWLLAAAGLACFVRALARRRHAGVARAAGWASFGLAALLATHGLTWFPVVAAAFVAVEIVRPGVRCFRAPAAAALAVLLAAGLAGPAASPAHAESPAPAMGEKRTSPEGEAAAGAGMAADSVEQTIRIGENRVTGEGVMRVRGEAGDRFDLLAAPAVLTRCDIAGGARVVRDPERRGGPVTQIELTAAGAAAVTFAWELPAMAEGTASFVLPTGKAAADTAEILGVRTEAEMQFASKAAVSVGTVKAGEGTTAASGARLVFAPVAVREIAWSPKARDRRSEKTVFYAETADLFVPAPGVLEGRHRVLARAAQGLLDELVFGIPAGFTVTGVQGKNAGLWRFDPEARRLTVRIAPASAPEAELLIETQVSVSSLPREFLLHPVTVEAAAGQIGLIAVAAGDEIQVTEAKPVFAEKLPAVSVDDFPAALLDSAAAAGDAGEGGGRPVVRRSYRYGRAADGGLTLRIAAVEPEVRVTGSQTVSLGEDRVVLAAALSVDITRAGIFRLTFALPAGLEVESISGPSLSHWTETGAAADGGAGPGRVVVLHLRGRTLGRQSFNLSFAGPGIAGVTRWEAPRVTIREASRQAGELLLTPEEGVRLHVTRRENATQFDPGRAAGVPRGALAFRLLQREWRLAFDIESLAPWIQCSYLQDMTVRDGQVRGAVQFDYLVENAATKALRVQLPADAGSVRFSGALVADAVPVAGSPGLWEVRLQRRALGKVVFMATFRRAVAGAGGGGTATEERIASVRAADAGLQHGWLALRTSGRLELKPGVLPAALQVTDWQAVPAALRQGAPEPAVVLRMVEGAFTLPVTVAVHDPAKLLPVRVEKADLQTMLSDEGVMLTRVSLAVRLAEKRVLRLTLPAGAEWWHGFVNDEPVRVAADGDALLLPVTPNPVEGQPSAVEFYYSARTMDTPARGSSGHRLAGPRFDVPLENITWRVHLPDGRELARQSSDLQFAGKSGGTAAGEASFLSVSDYKSFNTAVLRKKGEEADKLIRLGNRLRGEGDQEKARQALALANTLSKGNRALNEDARVQLDALRMEQIEVGLNRRRNFVVSNSGVVAVAGGPGGDGSLMPQQGLLVSPQAAAAGGDGLSTNYAAAEVAQLRDANTAEDNAVMRKVAGRFLSQQQTQAGVPDSIRTTIPDGGSGETLTFTRRLQVGADSDLSVQLSLADAAPGDGGLPLWLRAAAGAALFAMALLTSRMMRTR